MRSFTAKDAKAAEEQKSLTAKDAKESNQIIVVDHEVITGLPEGELATVVVCEVAKDRIRTVWFF
jgi:hypothetical protein